MFQWQNQFSLFKYQLILVIRVGIIEKEVVI